MIYNLCFMEYGKKIRIGGFNLLKYKNSSDMTFIKVSTVMGNWGMEYREDSVLFGFLDMERTKDQDNALHAMFVNAFMAASFAEADFQHDIIVASGELQKRIGAGAEPVSKEEDEEILDNLKAEHGVMEELLKEQGFGEDLTDKVKVDD